MTLNQSYIKCPDKKSLFSEADEKFFVLKNRLTAEETLKMSHDAIERLINDEGRKVLHDLYQGHLDLRNYSEAVEPVIGIDGQFRPHCRYEEKRTLTSVFGDVTVTRTRHEGSCTPSLCPVDADLNLPEEQYSLEVSRIAAKCATMVSYDATVEQVKESIGVEVPKRQVEEIVERASKDYCAYYEQNPIEADPAKTGAILVISFDGKGIPMREADLREQIRKRACEDKTPRLERKLHKGMKYKRNRKRMACVAAVYTIQPYHRTPENIIRAFLPEWPREKEFQRPMPEYKRVWASIVRSMEEVIAEAFAEAASRDPERRKHWVVLVDGDDKQLRRIRKLAKRYHDRVTILMDVVHVLSYIWKAARVFHPEDNTEAEQWVRERLLAALEGNAGQVAGGIRRSATLRGLTEKTRKPVDECARYLSRHKRYLGYNLALAYGYPIATGVIEGACRHLIRDRMELSGCRWSLKGAEALLRLRALVLSGDFDGYWEFHTEKELQRNHLAKYANGRVPTLARPRVGTRLRVVGR